VRHRIAVAAVLVALSLAGCSPASGRAGSSSTLNPRPFDGIAYPTADEIRLIHRATESLVADCMRAKGQEYHQSPPADQTRTATASPYLLLDPRQAKTDGYGIVAEALGGEPEIPAANEKLTAAMTDQQRRRWNESLTGTKAQRQTIRLPDGTATYFSTDGCVFTSRRTLYGDDWERLSTVAQAQSNQVINEVLGSAGFQRAVTDWSACMAKAGWKFDRLDAPRTDVSSRWTAAHDDATRRKVGEEELRLARADSRCQSTAGLDRAADTAQQQAESKLSDSFAADLAATRKANDAAKARATQIVERN
jgi:hypothetical protein